MTAAVKGTCYECGKPCELWSHPECCPHDEDITLAMSTSDPAKEDPYHGTCDDCGAEVEYEEDGEYDENGGHNYSHWVAV